jgi:hypothetical protein
LCLADYAHRREGVWGEWMYRFTFSWHRHYLEVNGWLHAPADFPPPPRGKNPLYPLMYCGAYIAGILSLLDYIMIFGWNGNIIFTQAKSFFHEHRVLLQNVLLHRNISECCYSELHHFGTVTCPSIFEMRKLFPCSPLLPVSYKNWAYYVLKTKLNSMVWVRERTIPTERPPLVGEVIANFCG